MLLSVSIFAQPPEEVDVKLWRRIIVDLGMKRIKIYATDVRMQEILYRIPEVALAKRCSEATLVIDTKGHRTDEHACMDIPHLTDDYRTLLKEKNAIGAFFWLKGRPTIIIAGPRLERYGLKVDAELQDYIEDIE